MYFLAQKRHMKKGQITFFHFKLISFFFFSATSYLLRSHPACWIASRDNSAAIPLTPLSTLLNVAVAQHGYVVGTVFVGKRLVLAYYFPTTPPRRFHIVFPTTVTIWSPLGNKRNGKSKTRRQFGKCPPWLGRQQDVWAPQALGASALVPCNAQDGTGPQNRTATWSA